MSDKVNQKNVEQEDNCKEQPSDIDNIEKELGNLNDTGDLQNMLNSLSNDENLTNLFKQFSSGFSNFTNTDNNNEDTEIQEDSEDLDFETLNLDKYLLSKDGDNLCDVLCSIKNELVNINNNLNKQ
jgi:hypothetical protein